MYALINKQQLFIFYGKECMPHYGPLIYMFFEMIRCSVEELGISTNKKVVVGRRRRKIFDGLGTTRSKKKLISGTREQYSFKICFFVVL